jgi:hypothetical protein
MKRDQRIWLRMKGANDARLGKSIDAFYETQASRLGVERLKESFRAEYEIGYRAAKDEMRREAAQKRLEGDSNA